MTGNKFLLIFIAGVVALLLWMKLTPDMAQKTDNTQVSQFELPSKQLETLVRRIESLEADLTAAVFQRQKLEQRLSKLEESSLTSMQVQPADTRSQLTQKPTLPEQEHDETQTLQDRLIAAGLAHETILAMQQRVDQNRLAMLQFRDQAIREGTDESVEFSEQIHELSNSTRGLREEFGNQLFDQYLYASGRRNRIVIREVYSGSAADDAGLLPGDIIISYASSEIFSMTELRQATVEGTAGETVLVEIKRDESPWSTSVPRGPLGISMNMIRYQP